MKQYGARRIMVDLLVLLAFALIGLGLGQVFLLAPDPPPGFHHRLRVTPGALYSPVHSNDDVGCGPVIVGGICDTWTGAAE